MRSRFRLIFLALLLVLAACETSTPTGRVPTPLPANPTSLATQPPAASPTSLATQLPAASPTSAPTPAGLPTIVPTKQASQPLPRALLYIDARQQLARLQPDGSITELTNEPGNLIDFDVSPTDGSLAYLVIDSSQQTTLMRAAPDGSKALPLARGILRSPVFRPDGRQASIAVVLASAKVGDQQLDPGVWSLPLDGGPAQALVRSTDPISATDGTLTPGIRYAPLEWSPDSSTLLLLTTPNYGPDAPEGDVGSLGLAALDAASGSVRQLVPPGGNPRLCIQPVWASDSASVYCPTPYDLGEATPALFRITLDTNPDQILIPRSDSANRTTALLGLHSQPNSSIGLFSYSTGETFDGAAFERFSDDPTKRTLLARLPESSEAGMPVLWAPDGNGAIYFSNAQELELVWQSFDGSPPRVLVAGPIGRPRWDKE
jgi:hypothetical protein